MTPRTRTDWKDVIERVSFQERDITPTLRTLFYRQVSLEAIPNTNQAYKPFSSACVEARKNGKLPWDCFSDEGRQVLEDFVEEYQPPAQYVQSCIDLLSLPVRVAIQESV